MHAFMSKYDAWLTPVLSSTPPKLGEQAPTVQFDALLARVTNYVAYTPIHNVAGTPAMSVPLGWGKNGLPIGSQFAAAKGSEGRLYALAYELEQAQPWAAKHGALWVG
jgi:amidase